MVFVLMQIQEKCREQNTDLYAAIVDLTKAFDTVIRDGLWKILMGQEDFIPDPSVVFPQTLCSTVTDRTSLTDHALKHGLTHRFIGLYAVLAHMQYNIPTGDQDGECPTFMGKFRICEEKFQKQAFEECLGLLHTPSIIKCFDGGFTNVTATLVCGTCLDYHCSASLAACSRLSEYQGTCPTVGSIVDLSECANFNP
ncbi:hypothetical protein ACOMHN_001305 [Nucella lapillus]